MNQILEKKFASLAKAKYRKEHGLFLVEGEHCVEELLKSDWHIVRLLISDPEKFKYFSKLVKKNTNIELIKPKTLSSIATTVTPQSVVAVVQIRKSESLSTNQHNRILIADNIKDPGNMGTIIRSATAFGFGLVITTKENVDIFNPKVVRSTQGAMFHIELAVNLEINSIITQLKKTHKLYALSSQGSINIAKIDPEKKSALVVGSEIQGLSEKFTDAADFLLRIPVSDKVESLNAASAAAVAMYKLSDCANK
jgi:TrmH family RNA methyltransferase